MMCVQSFLCPVQFAGSSQYCRFSLKERFRRFPSPCIEIFHHSVQIFLPNHAVRAEVGEVAKIVRRRGNANLSEMRGFRAFRAFDFQ